MTLRILTVRITQQNLAAVRDRTRQVGELFGLDKLDCTRFITAVSEIARNTAQYAGEGNLMFLFTRATKLRRQCLVAQVSDEGPGIGDVAGALAGRPNARGQASMGLAGARRLADRFQVEQPAGGGTLVTIEMDLPENAPPLAASDLASLVDQLARRAPRSPLEEMEAQNREMLITLQALRDRKAELEVADERKNQFVATLAHELRNPLGTLQMSLEVLRRKTHMDPDELAARCAVMERQANQLAQLVDDLMDVSRVSQGKVELRRLPTEMNDLVAKALEMTDAAVRAKHHVVELALSDDPIWVDADPTRLKQVLSNLIHNATRYSGDHSHIAIRVRQSGPDAVVEVSDDGIGIAPDLLPHVFGLFVQGQHELNGGSAGLGVGLTLVQHLVHEHGGSVTAASAGLGQGSQFTVVLPLVAAPG
jgi:signal transduction histidine kinase